MDNPKQQAVDRIKQANSVLVTVSANPSVDQLAACIGLTLALNKLGKHATAVFSGAVPSTIEFLQPDKTIEKNTDSLRDFIIALDKSKADKLRYKVEDKVVKIFITPYRTSISEKDLDFSQGDFNVDVIVALGVHNQVDLDQVITAHGRILHDATVVTVNFRTGGDDLGGINWIEPGASSLSELSTELIDSLDKNLLDKQTATALLTGIVAETDRFSNMQTSPQTMSVSAELMAAGADQQLVAAKLEEAPPAPAIPIPSMSEPAGTQPGAAEPPKPDDGTLEITHEDKPAEQADRISLAAQPLAPPSPQPVLEEEEPAPPPPQIHIDEHGSIKPLDDMLPPIPPESSEPPSIIRHHEEMTPSEEGTAEQLPGASPTGEGYLAAPATPPVFGTDDMDDEGPSGGAPQQGGFIIGEHAPGTPPAEMNDAPTDVGAAQQPPTGLVQPSVPPQPAMVAPVMGPPPEPAQALAPPLGETLSDLEKEVHSPHGDTQLPVDNTTPPPAITPTQDVAVPPPPVLDSPQPQEAQGQTVESDVDRARDAVADAIENAPAQVPQLESLSVAQPPAQPAVQPPPVAPQPPPEVPQYDPNAPPPLPPPMMPPPGSY